MKHARRSAELPVDFEQHMAFTDEKFREYLKIEFGATESGCPFFAKAGYNLAGRELSARVRDGGRAEKERFLSRRHPGRPMMKDSVGVFLFPFLSER